MKPHRITNPEQQASYGEEVGPLVSIVTATYNAAGTIAACMQSVASQDYPRVEHVIVDGGSADGTMNLVQRELRLGRWVSERDEGIFDAWNKGLQLAQGEWIAFLGADDILLPGAVRAYMELARWEPAARYLSSRVRWIGRSGRTRVLGKPWRWPEFQRYMSTAHPGSMHHRELFEQLGAYDPALRIVADYELLLRAGPALRAAFLPMITVRMQGGGNSDRLDALDEAAQVKVATGRRSRALAAWEHLMARQAFRLRRLVFG